MPENEPAPPTFVRDLMSVGVPTCSPDTPIDDLTKMLLEKELEGAVVLDEQGHAVGVVSRDELVKAYAKGEHSGLTAEAVMRDIPLTAAAQLMQDMGVRIVFLMHHAGGIEYPAAMISYTHLLRHLAMEDVEELRDLGIEAERESPIDIFIRRRDEARRRAMGK